MKIIRNPELKGILTLILIIFVLGFFLAATNGKLEQWFNVTWFSGPRITDKIIYVSEANGQPDVFVMDNDGANKKQFTKDAKVKVSPSVLPNGTRIVFVASFGKEDQVYSVNGVGEALTRLTTATGSKDLPAFSPDGKQLSFLASGKVFVTQINGDSPSAVLPTLMESKLAMIKRTEPKLYSDYCWGAGSNTMLGVFKDKNDSDVLVYLPDFESEGKVIPVSPEGDVHCVGITRAFDENIFVCSFTIGNDGVLLMFDATSGQGKILMRVKNIEFSRASFSPGGSQIIVAINSTNNATPSGILKLQMDSGKAQLIIVGNYESPIFSPDGNSILATKVDNKTGEKDVVSIDSFTGNIENLTTNGKSHNAIFSPVTEK